MRGLVHDNTDPGRLAHPEAPPSSLPPGRSSGAQRAEADGRWLPQGIECPVRGGPLRGPKAWRESPRTTAGTTWPGEKAGGGRMPLGGDPGSLKSVEPDTRPSLTPVSRIKESTALALLYIVSTTFLPFPADPNSPPEESRRSLGHCGIPIVRQVRPQGRGCAPTGVWGRGWWDRGAEGRRDRRGYYLHGRWTAPDGCPGWEGGGGSLSRSVVACGSPSPRPVCLPLVPRRGKFLGAQQGHGKQSPHPPPPSGQRVYSSGLEQPPPPLWPGSLEAGPSHSPPPVSRRIGAARGRQSSGGGPEGAMCVAEGHGSAMGDGSAGGGALLGPTSREPIPRGGVTGINFCG